MPKASGASRGGGIIGSTITYQSSGRFKNYGEKTVTVTQGLLDDANRAKTYWHQLKSMDKKSLLAEYQSTNRLDTSHMNQESATDIRFALLNQRFGGATLSVIDQKLGGTKFLNKK